MYAVLCGRMEEALSERSAPDWLMRTGCGGGERARESLQRDLSVSSPLGTRKAQLMRPILTMLRPRSLSSDVLSRVLVRVSVSDDREPIIDFPKVEPLVLPTLADLPAPGCWKLARPRTRSWNDWVSKVYRDVFGEEVSKDHEWRGARARVLRI